LVSALIISLFIHLATLLLLNKKEKTIPLAGLVAILFIVVLIIEFSFCPGKLQNDTYVANLIGIYYV
jgi:hypothetical protein